MHAVYSHSKFNVYTYIHEKGMLLTTTGVCELMKRVNYRGGNRFSHTGTARYETKLLDFVLETFGEIKFNDWLLFA